MSIINTFQQIVQNLRLGVLLSSPAQLSGGALHKIWAFTTNQGDYVAKQINQYITTKPTFPESYQCSEEIAEVFYRKGLPAVSAIDIGNSFVHRIQDEWFIIYPRVEGKIININDLKTKHAVQIGEVFADMHQLNISIKGVDKPHYDHFTNDEWENLISQTGFETLKSLIPVIYQWNTTYERAIPVLNENLVITHRDLHHTNVLWFDDRPRIIDWESAGLMNPTMEIVGYGLEWAGIIFNHPINKLILEALLNAYHARVNTQFSKIPVDFAFYGWLGHCVLGWTEFNLRRSLGLTSKDENEIVLGKEILETKMIPTLFYLSDNAHSLIPYLKEKLAFQH